MPKNRKTFKKFFSQSKSLGRAKKKRSRDRKTRIETLERKELLTTFYVDGIDGEGLAGGGSDQNDGLSLATPFATVQQAANLAQPGDTIEIRGGTYREQVSLPRSGTDSNPIVFQPYNNENVTITATDQLTGFEQTSEQTDDPNVYVASLNGSTTNSLLNRHELTVFVNGQVVQEAKSNNNANELNIDTWDRYNTVSGNTLTDTSRSVPFNSDLVGAYLNVRVNNFSIVRARITAASGNTLTVDRNISGNSNGFYLIHDDRSLVDSAGEWYFDEESNQFFLWAPDGGDPDNFTVEVKRRAEAFVTNSREHIHFKNLTLTGGDFDLGSSSNLLLDGIHIIAPDRISGPDFGTTRTALTFNGDNNTVINSEFEQIWSAAIRLEGTGNVISNNYFHDIAFNGGGAGGVVLRNEGIENLVSYNTFVDSGRAAIAGTGVRNIFEHNDFSRVGLITEDTGAFYYNEQNVGSSIIRYNTFHDINNSLMSGVYTDNGVTDLAVHNNLFYDISPFGGKFNLPNSFLLAFNNTYFGSGLVDAFGAPSERISYGSRFYNNIYSTFDNDLLAGSEPFDFQGNFQTTFSGNFENAGTGDFRLRSSSNAIDAGIPIPGITDGFNGSAPDAGAIEFGDPLFVTGHDFDSPPPASELQVEYEPVFFSNRVENGGFEQNLTLNGYGTVGTPLVSDDSSSSYQNDPVGRFGARSVQLNPGDGISQTVTGLRPNTSYTITGQARIVGPILQAENATSSVPIISNYRSQAVRGQLRNNDTVTFDNVDFGSGSDLYNQLQVGLAQATPGTTIDLFLDNVSGSPLASISATDPPNSALFYLSNFDVSSVTGTHDVILRFRGSGDLGLLDEIRLVNTGTTEQVEIGVRDFDGAAEISQMTGGVDFSGERPTLEFRTGPDSTSATLFFTKPAGSTYDAYVDALSLAESASPVDVTVDLSRTAYNYDVGVAFQPDVLSGGNPAWELLALNTTGDIRWTGPVGAFDGGTLAGSNANNQDFAFGSAPATLNHRLLSGRWRVNLNMSSPYADLDNMQVRAEGQLVASNIDRFAGQPQTFSFDVDVNDGELNLEFSDADAVNPEWSLNRISLVRLSDPGIIVDLGATQYLYDLGTSTSPVESGYIQIDPDTNGDIRWSGGAIDAVDRGDPGGATGALNQDFAFASGSRTFNHVIDNGIWDVTITLGDRTTARDNMSVVAEGVALDTDVDTAINSFVTVQGQVTVLDGELNLDFDDLGGSDSDWTVTSVRLDKIRGLDPVIVDLSATQYDYDFGTPDSAVKNSFQRISEETTGDIFWSVPVSSADDASVVDEARRDFVFSNQTTTLNHAIANGVWEVSLLIGDASAAHDDIRIRAEGRTISDDLDSALGEFIYVSADGASTSPTSFLVAVDDGELNLEFADLGGADPNWLVNQLSVSFVETLPTPGDFNRDGFVDSLDIAQWQGDYGTNGSSDADFDGDTDGNDFLLWQRNFTGGPTINTITLVDADTNNGSFETRDPHTVPGIAQNAPGLRRAANTNAVFRVGQASNSGSIAVGAWEYSGNGFHGQDGPSLGAQDGQSVMITNNSANNTATSAVFVQTVNPGDTFDVSFYTANNGNGSSPNHDYELSLLLDGTTTLPLVSGNFTVGVDGNANEWTQISATEISAPSSGSFSTVQLIVSLNNPGQPGSNDQVYLDNLSLEINSVDNGDNVSALAADDTEIPVTPSVTPLAAASTFRGESTPTVMGLTLPSGVPEQFNTEVQHAGETYTLQLDKNWIFGENTRFLIDNGNGELVQIDHGEDLSYLGTVAENPNYSVSALLTPEGLRATIIRPGQVSLVVEPAAVAAAAIGVGQGTMMHQVFAEEAGPATHDHDHDGDGIPDHAPEDHVDEMGGGHPPGCTCAACCGQASSTDPNLPAAIATLPPTRTIDVREYEIGVEIGSRAFFADTAYNGNLATAMAVVQGIPGNLDARYLRAAGIKHRLGTVIIRTNAATDPLRNSVTATGLAANASSSLAAFRDYWNNPNNTDQNGSPIGATHDLAVYHVLSSPSGLAYVSSFNNGTVGTDNRYATSGGNGATSWANGTLAHEFGHSWTLAHVPGGFEDSNDFYESRPRDNRNAAGGEDRFISIMHGSGTHNIGRLSSGEASRVLNSKSSKLAFGDPVDPGPVAPFGWVDSAATSGEQITIDVIANDHDANNDVLDAEVRDTVSFLGGTITLSNDTGPGGRNEIIYTPPANTSGVDFFHYTVRDSTGRVDWGAVYVVVDNPVISVDPLGTSFNYDLGPSTDSAVFAGATLLSPNTLGDVNWSSPVNALDNNPGDQNAYNRDFVEGTAPTTLNHKLGPGKWKVRLNLGDTENPVDNIVVKAENQVFVSSFENPDGSVGLTQEFDVFVTDGELNLEFSDADAVDPRWVVNRILLDRVQAIGDFNSDGFVFSDDLPIWQASFGQNANGDTDGDGDSDGADFLDWQRNFQTIETVTLFDANTNNGSFETINPHTAPITNSSGRRAVNGSTVFRVGQGSNSGTIIAGAWEYSGSGFHGQDRPNGTLGQQDGNFVMIANNGASNTATSGIISQAITPGDTFDLSFYTANNGNGNNPNHNYAVSLLLDGTTSLPLVEGNFDVGTDGSANEWVEIVANEIAVPAGSSFSTVQLVIELDNPGGGGADDQVYIDNVSLTLQSISSGGSLAALSSADVTHEAIHSDITAAEQQSGQFVDAALAAFIEAEKTADNLKTVADQLSFIPVTRDLDESESDLVQLPASSDDTTISSDQRKDHQPADRQPWLSDDLLRAVFE